MKTVKFTQAEHLFYFSYVCPFSSSFWCYFKFFWSFRCFCYVFCVLVEQTVIFNPILKDFLQIIKNFNKCLLYQKRYLGSRINRLFYLFYLWPKLEPKLNKTFKINWKFCKNAQQNFFIFPSVSDIPYLSSAIIPIVNINLSNNNYKLRNTNNHYSIIRCN